MMFKKNNESLIIKYWNCFTLILFDTFKKTSKQKTNKKNLTRNDFFKIWYLILKIITHVFLFAIFKIFAIFKTVFKFFIEYYAYLITFEHTLFFLRKIVREILLIEIIFDSFQTIFKEGYSFKYLKMPIKDFFRG